MSAVCLFDLEDFGSKGADLIRPVSGADNASAVHFAEDQGSSPAAQRFIQTVERFIQKQNVRLCAKGAGNSGPPLHPAGERFRTRRSLGVQFQCGKQGERFFLRPVFQPDILQDGKARQEAVFLKYRAQTELLRADDPAFIRRFQPGQKAKERGLSGP